MEWQHGPKICFKNIYLKQNLFMYLFSAVLDLHCCLGFSLVAVSGGYSVIVAHGFLIAVASLVTQHDSRAPGLQ